jgi:hypothetical protein
LNIPGDSALTSMSGLCTLRCAALSRRAAWPASPSQKAYSASSCAALVLRCGLRVERQRVREMSSIHERRRPETARRLRHTYASSLPFHVNRSMLVKLFQATQERRASHDQMASSPASTHILAQIERPSRGTFHNFGVAARRQTLTSRTHRQPDHSSYPSSSHAFQQVRV